MRKLFEVAELGGTFCIYFAKFLITQCMLHNPPNSSSLSVNRYPEIENVLQYAYVSRLNHIEKINPISLYDLIKIITFGEDWNDEMINEWLTLKHAEGSGCGLIKTLSRNLPGAT
jgi:hypothetical protein